MRRPAAPPRRRRAARWSVILVAVLWALPTISGAVMEGLSTEDLARGAELVVVGDVESVAAGWSADRATIVTTAVLAVTDVVKGQSAGRRIEVRIPGGEVGDIGFKVSDEPRMEPGERVLVFLTRAAGPDDSNGYRLVGKGQGKYTIGPDGIARKKGFTLAGKTRSVDAEIPLGALIEKIERAE